MALTLIFLALFTRTAAAAESLCDAAFQDCRAPLINLIRQENVHIDVAFWFMEDSRISTEIIKRWQAGVPVRVIIDQRAMPSQGGGHPVDEQIVATLKNAGIPIRQRSLSNSYILHWKTMIFQGQNTVEFSGANYSPTAFVPQSPYSDYEDEAIYFTDDASIVGSFMTKFDDLWTSTTNYADYANITAPLTRIYPTFPKDPQLNFPQEESYANRLLGRYSKETQAMDVIMFRITDERETNAVIQTFQRGIPVRLYSDTDEYREPSRQWVSYNMDKLWAAGVPLKVRFHAGLNHQKLVLFKSQGMAVFGSSNWTSPSDKGQQEHNMFSTKPWIYQWFEDQFNRKWNNTATLADGTSVQETDWFVPLPPDKPVALAPADGSTGQPLSVALKWDGGYYAHFYDIYFGTDPNPPLYRANLQLGPKDFETGATQKLVLPLLQHGTTYYWKIVGRTMAGKTRTSNVFSFTTDGTRPPYSQPPSDAKTVVMWTSTNVAPSDVYGDWQFTNDATAAGGRALLNPDHATAKISPPLAAPTNYFETTFTAVAGVPYHLWVRLKAQGNSLTNNSVSVQFDDAIDEFGTPLYRIGSGQGGEVVLQDPSGSISGWGWEDNGFQGGGATMIYFPTSGTHRLRIQQRYDGAMVDQILLSPDAFLTQAPGPTKNDSSVYGSTVDGAAPPSAGSWPQAQPPLPSGWQRTDIGAVGMPGYAEIDSNAVFTVVGAGADVWGTADALHYAYTTLSGDGSIIARVSGIQNTNAWVKAGVMIRNSTAPGAAQAFMLLSYSKGSAYQRRLTDGGSSVGSTPAASHVAPYWVRLDRTGSVIKAFRSPDGVTWTQVGSDTYTMGATVLVGLAVSSHSTEAVAAVTFDNVKLNGQAVLPQCIYSLTPASTSIGADGGPVSVGVNTGNTCAWNSTSNTDWITVTSGSGTASGTAGLSVAANTGAGRTGTATVAGQTFSVSQAAASCGVTLSPDSKAMDVNGDTATITVAAADWCNWTAVSSAPSWLTIAGPSSGTGNGTVSVNAAANPGGARTATVAFGSTTFTATQAAAPCTYAISPSSQALAAGGDVGNVTVTTGSWCSWSAASNDPWLTVTAGGSGTGNGPVQITASANPAGTRTGTVTIAGLTYTATQMAAPCTYSLSPASQTLATGGDTASFTVSVGSWCAWSATSSASWLTITSGSTGSGSATITATAPANTGAFRTATITVGGQTFTASQPGAGLPAGWAHQDVGAVGPAGDAIYNGTAYSVIGGGADVWGTADAFHYAYRTLTGDGSITARVASVQNVNAWTKAGVMIRETLDPGSANAFMLVSAGKGQSFQRRSSAGGTTVSTAGPLSGAPYWVRLDRAGNTITAYQSVDGVIWNLVGADTVPMGATVYIGLGTSSHVTTATATASFDNVSVTTGTPISPAPWMHKDIGSVAMAGNATFNGSTGTYSVKGAGADVWGTADAFHYLYRPLTGDGTIVARVASVQNVNSWTKAGVMIRETLDPGAANAFMLVSYSKGTSFQRRAGAGGATINTAGANVAAPYWVKLERSGSTFNAYTSPDGSTWTLVGTDTVPMATTVYVGLAVSGHSTAAATSTFDNVIAP